MTSPKVILLSLVIVVVLSGSCTEMNKMAEVGTQTLAEEELPGDASIPSVYGDLVSVSSVAAFPDFLQLWFQDHNGDIRLVRYNISENRFMKVSHVMRRK